MNLEESRAKHALEEQGRTVLRNGWPDFLVVQADGRVFGLEWKADHDVVRPAQCEMHAALKAAGLPVLVTGSVDEALAFAPSSPGQTMSHQEEILRDKLVRSTERLERELEFMRQELNAAHRAWRMLTREKDALERDIARTQRLRESLWGHQEDAA